MVQKFIAACIQNCATPDVEADIAILAKLVDKAGAAGASLIALPEYCAGLDTKNGMLHPFAVPESDHPVLPAMAALAKSYKAWILVGSIGIKAADGRIFNRSYMLAPDGAIAARYDKIHMFDVDLGDGHHHAGRGSGAFAVHRRTGRPVDLLRSALRRALPHAGQGRRPDAGGAGRLHPHHR
jgi:deaminated glutathione amidase